MDFTQAHRARRAHGVHRTTDAPSGENDCDEPNACLACGSEALGLFRALRGRVQYECEECGGVVEVDADRVDLDGVDGVEK